MSRIPVATAMLGLALLASSAHAAARFPGRHDALEPSRATVLRERVLGMTSRFESRASRVVSEPVLDAWTGGGVPVTATAYPQVWPVLTADGAGGAFVAWLDFRDFVLDSDVYLTRLDPNGNYASGWSANGTAVSLLDSLQIELAIAPDGAGGVFVTFTEFLFGPTSLRDVIVQRIGSNGAIAGGFPANGRRIALGDIQGYDMESDGAGGLLLTYLDANSQTRVLRLDGSANVVSGWPAAGIPVGPAENFDLDVASDGAGGFYVASASNDSVVAWRYGANGALATGWTAAGNLLAQGSLFAFAPHVARLTSGDAMVSWQDFRNFDFDFFAVRVAANGTFPAPWAENGITVNAGTGSQTPAFTLSDEQGGGLVLWEEFTLQGERSLFAQRVTGAGAIAVGWDTGVSVCPSTPNKQSFDAIPSGGGVLVAWSDTTAGSSTGDIFLTRIAADGTRPAGFPAGGKLVCSTPEEQLSPRLTTNGANGAIVAWEDERDGLARIYVAQVLLDGTVRAQAALVHASAEPGLVRLHWFDPGGAFRATLERDAGAGYTPLATLDSDPSGHLRWEDRDVLPGAEYRYRLVVDDEGARRALGEVALRIPDGLALAIEGARPHPATGPLTLAFTLPATAPARLEVMDVAGRRVAARDLSDATAGRHVVRLDAALPPGVYLVRLAQGGRAAQARVVVAE